MAFLPTNASQVQQFAVALYGIQVGTSTMSAVQSDITLVGGLNNALNSYYATSFGSTPTADVAASIAANLGLTEATGLADVTSYIAAQLNAAPAGARGQVINSVLNLFSTLSSNAVIGTAVTAWNAKVAAAVSYTGAADLVTAAGAPIVASGAVFTLSISADTFQPNSATAANQTTAGDDTFRATASGDLASADSINGGAGKDTLNAVQTGATAGVTIKPLLTSVENVNLVASSGATAANTVTLDLADSTGVESVFLKDAVGTATTGTDFTTTVSNLIAGAKAGIIGGSVGSAGGNAPSLTVGVKDASTNTADVLSITLSDALAGTVTAANIETINLVNSNTAATTSSTVAAVTADSVKTLNIDGSGTLTVTALTGTGATLTALNIAGSAANTITTATGTQTALKTIDASTATGANKVAVSGTAIANTKITMGAGNDTVTFDSSANVSTAIGTEGKVDGGSGKNTLKFSDDTLNTTDNAAIAKVVNFQVIEDSYAGVASTTSLSLVASDFTSINEFVFSGANVGKTGVTGATPTAASDALAVTSVENNDAFVIANNFTGGAGAGTTAPSAGAGGKGASFAPKIDNGSNVLNLTLKGSATTAATEVTVLGAEGVTGSLDGKAGVDASTFETVNVSSTGKNTSDTTWADANAITGGALSAGGAAGKAVVLNTNGKLVITGNKHLDLSTGVDGQNASVDASAFTGMSKITTSNGNNTIIGGSGKDTITGGTGVDTLTGGASADTFVIAAADAGITGAETVTDYALGSDILDIAPTTVLADLATATDVSSAITSAAVGDTLTAKVSKGIITLAGNATAKIDTVAELKAIFEVIDANNTAQVGTIVMGGNTYLITDAQSGAAGTADTVNDIIQLTGVTTAVAVSATAATNVIVIA